MSHSVQSMDEDVLKSIKRSNIKFDAYQKVTEHVRSKGIRTLSQTILGLPKETLQTHLTGLQDMVDNGMDSLQNFQLMLLKGSEIESQDSRDEFEFETKFRLSPRCFGNYGEKTVFDVEEIVVATKSLSFDEYVIARKNHLAYMMYWSQSWFDDFFYFAQSVGIKNSTCMKAIVEEIISDDEAVGKLMQAFIAETKAEVFSSPEECFRYYTEGNRFEKLVSGEIGDNLLNKYHAKASFILWPKICVLAGRVMKRLIVTQGLDDPGREFESFWGDLCLYVEYRHAYGCSAPDILSPANCRLQYDISKWIAEGRPKALSDYKLEAPKVFQFKLNEVGAKEISDAIDTWSTDLSGLTKVARHLTVASQVRQCI
jgi:hypothetical protein